MSDARLIDENQAADMLGVDRSTLFRWRARGWGPPFVRLGDPEADEGRAREAPVRYRTDTLLAWVEALPARTRDAGSGDDWVVPAWRPLTDADWEAVRPELDPTGRMGPHARQAFERLLHLSHTGASVAAEGGLGSAWLAGERLQRAIEALRAVSPDRAYSVAAVWCLLPPPPKREPPYALPSLLLRSLVRGTWPFQRIPCGAPPETD